MWAILAVAAIAVALFLASCFIRNGEIPEHEIDSFGSDS